MSKLALVDGSLRPGTGNTARALDAAAARWEELGPVDHVELATYDGTVEALAARLEAADALLFGTGSYWGSWGSPLQRFLEVMTGYEARPPFFGKPAGAIVTMDSTGGSEVAARLVATLLCFGCVVPPFGWLALSRIGVELAAMHPASTEDVWTLADVAVLTDNLHAATTISPSSFRAWPIDHAAPVTGPWPASGPLPGIAPDFGRP